MIFFSGPTKTFFNRRIAERDMGGTPDLAFDTANKTIELIFKQSTGQGGYPLLQSVCGLKGEFGPLEQGEWLFFCNNPNATFSLHFSVHIDDDDDDGQDIRIYYVDANAVGQNDGSSWTNAFRYLQDALEAATSGCQIRVAKGVYKPEGSAGIGFIDREATFQLKNGVTIKGGYAGVSGPNPNARGIELFETILSGDLNGDDVNVSDPCDLLSETSRIENSIHVVTGSGTDATAVLDGFIITGGNASGENGYEDMAGGGVYISGGGPTLANCYIIANVADERGGGVYSGPGSNPTFANCVFSANTALYYGGAMYNHGSDPCLVSCTFEGNWSGDFGGAIDNYKSDPDFSNCTIIGNSTGSNGGGMYNDINSRATLTNCDITGNSAVYYGGGIRNGGSSLSLKHCVIDRNYAGRCGGGLISYSALNMTNCIIERNTARLFGGGIYTDGNCTATLAHCIISANSAEYYGGGMYNKYNSQLKVVDCLFSGNRTIDNEVGFGGAIHNNGVSLQLTNCTFVGNSASLGNALTCYSYGSIYPSSVQILSCVFWNGNNELWNNDSSVITIDYSDVQGGWLEGVGNIDADPCFVSIGYWDPNGTPDNTEDDFWVDGDCRLLFNSPCIDAGDPNYIPEPNETDLEGDPRIIGTAVDMGVDEFWNVPPVSDAGFNQTVWAKVGGTAEVILDGSGSYDPDNDNLTYTWLLESVQIAEGVNPTIELPAGDHTIELIVSDGIEDSEPDNVLVSVSEAIEVNLEIFPDRIDRRQGRTIILAVVTLPHSIDRKKVDNKQALLLYPGGDKAVRQLFIRWFGKELLLAFFDRKELVAAVPNNGNVELSVIGQLKTGERLYGTDTVRIVGSQ